MESITHLKVSHGDLILFEKTRRESVVKRENIFPHRNISRKDNMQLPGTVCKNVEKN